MSGFAGYQSNHFCSYCTLELIDIDDFDYPNWPKRTQEEHRRMAEEWKSAPSEAVRDKVFERSGIRWSQLLRLPYWDPTKHVMIDSMHGFLLRLFQRHCRQIWGMGVDIVDSEYPSFSQDKDRPSDEAMAKGYKILRHGNEKQLQGLKTAVLRELARLSESMPYGGRSKKLIRGLLEYVSGFAMSCPKKLMQLSEFAVVGLTKTVTKLKAPTKTKRMANKYFFTIERIQPLNPSGNEESSQQR
ncbi:hypothetical protein CPB83DRAFT_778715 [Crepidotus variabilis]|uniref:Uncharacterized protein n=1 Tax=Crepidotus variabilis TaxID=179855 RepID=A0A9P6E2N7_9AGAR|nr:hypothetical protein CPB83DRAFT_778715 [Crepidotus variabilis]